MEKTIILVIFFKEKGLILFMKKIFKNKINLFSY